MNEHPARMACVDALRGVAAVGVFLFHVAVVVGFDKRTLPPISALGRTWTGIPSVFSFGATGVTLFFVLSGFCLALKPLASGNFSAPIYYRDRFARIYPAYFVTVLFSLLVLQIIGREWTGLQALAVGTFLQGFIQEWHFGINGALWSMSTEVQFYLVFPLVLLALRRFGPRIAVAALLWALAFRLAVLQLPSADFTVGGINRATFLMNTLAGRLPDFVLGSVLAHLWMRDPVRVRRIAGLVLLPALVFGVAARLKGPTWFADPALAVMCAAVLAFTVTHIRLPSSSWLAAFGRASYSFFLLHLPITTLAAAAVGMRATGTYTEYALVASIGFGATLVLSAALYRLVELPALAAIKGGLRGAAPAAA